MSSQNEFQQYYQALPNVDSYLRRLGLAGLQPEPDLKTLNKILYAHLRSIPFENLDAWTEKKCPSLAISDLYEKIIMQRRGGWCFELNLLLYSLLKSIGYEAYPVCCRITLGFEELIPIGHCAVICVIDGKKYYCDVGFGNIALQSAIPLDGTLSPYGFYIKSGRGWYSIWRSHPADEELIRFADTEFEPIDFLALNAARATEQNGRFNAYLYVSIMDGDTRKLLNDRGLLIYENGRKHLAAQPNSRRELSDILQEHFNIVFNFAAV